MGLVIVDNEKRYDFVARAQAKHGDRFDYDNSHFVGFTKPIEVVCRTHGACQTTPKSHLYSKSGGCPRCREVLVRNALRNTTEQFVRRAREVHGDHYRYDQVRYAGSLRHVTIVCPEHGPFRMKPARHLEGRGCRQCTFRELSAERRLLFWEFIERVIEVHGAHKYEYTLADFVNVFSKIRIRCPKHGEFRQNVAAHLKGSGCPRCIQSSGERRVREALLALGVRFREQVRFRHCRDRRALPFDFYVPECRLLVEYDGRQHYENSELWGGQEKLAETQRHDAIKNAFAKKHGFRLLRIPYFEQDQIEDLLLEHLTAVAA